MAIRQFEYEKRDSDNHAYNLKVPNDLWDKLLEKCEAEYESVHSFIIRAIVQRIKEDK